MPKVHINIRNDETGKLEYGVLIDVEADEMGGLTLNSVEIDDGPVIQVYSEEEFNKLNASCFYVSEE